MEASELEVVRVEEVVVQAGLPVTKKTPAEDAGHGGLLRRCSGAPRFAWWGREQKGETHLAAAEGRGGVRVRIWVAGEASRGEESRGGCSLMSAGTRVPRSLWRRRQRGEGRWRLQGERRAAVVAR